MATRPQRSLALERRRPTLQDDAPQLRAGRRHGPGPGRRLAPGPSRRQTIRSTISFLISEMALAGFSPLGQVLVQFMIVWQR